MMKKLFLVLGLLGMVTACSLNNDDGPTQRLAVLPIDSVAVPDTLFFGEKDTLSVNYTQPGACYSFNGFQFNNADRDSIFTITVVNTVNLTVACDSTPRMDTREFEFNVGSENSNSFETYVFKFYQGNDASGDPIYLTKNVPVKRQ